MAYAHNNYQNSLAALSARLGLWWLAALFWGPVCTAQQASLHFENLASAQGLSQTSVQAILQDHQGFMWFGTQDGLNRFDGYAFTHLKHQTKNPESLSDNWIRSLYEDPAGILWIGTRSGGLNRLDPASGKRQANGISQPRQSRGFG